MRKRNKEIIVGLLLALLVVIFLAPMASTSPDGLEKVAEDHAFIEKAAGKEVISSPIPDYQIPGLENQTVAGILAGIFGIVITFSGTLVLGKLIKASRKNVNAPHHNG